MHLDEVCHVDHAAAKKENAMDIRLACEADLDFLIEHDHHVSPAVLSDLICQEQIFLAMENDAPIGWMRWNLFWDNTPFLNMLYLLDGYRRKGYGRAMMAHWEWWMREQGFQRLLTSTQSDEEAQHFYRYLGYRECGALLLPGEPLEMIFLKELP